MCNDYTGCVDLEGCDEKEARVAWILPIVLTVVCRVVSVEKYSAAVDLMQVAVRKCGTILGCRA